GGHGLGPGGLPEGGGASLLRLGAGSRPGPGALVRSLKGPDPGVAAGTAGGDIIPPLSDYEPFWRAKIPFLFLSVGRSRVYHTPEDTPDKLDYPKIEATARWLTQFVSATRTRLGPVRFDEAGSGDPGTPRETREAL